MRSLRLVRERLVSVQDWIDHGPTSPSASGGTRLDSSPEAGWSRRRAPRKSFPAPPRPRGESGELERLQKVLAHAGIGSRRACEEVILQGRVTVDGQVVRELGTRVDPHRAKIAVDGEPIRLERMVYYAVNKPKGYVSTNHDPSGRPRVVDLLPEIPQRVYTVGRLDEMSTGLMLLTNDGELANRLAHPKFGVEKLYRAVVAGTPEPRGPDQADRGGLARRGQGPRQAGPGRRAARARRPSWRWSWPRARTARSAGCSPSSGTRSCR